VAGGMLAGWWIYVPVHELLHAAGCRLTGGGVTRLEIGAVYGGALLSRVLPFVVAGGEDAGRLSGFDTHRSDRIYLPPALPLPRRPRRLVAPPRGRCRPALALRRRPAGGARTVPVGDRRRLRDRRDRGDPPGAVGGRRGARAPARRRSGGALERPGGR